MKQRVDIYIYYSKRKGRKEFQSKCPRVVNLKQLINKLLKTTFPIYYFPEMQEPSIIKFTYLRYFTTIKEMTSNEYIKDMNKNSLNIKIQEYDFEPKPDTFEKESNSENGVSWELGLKIVYDIYMTFHTHIKKILRTIDNDPKLLVSKRVEINGLIDQIIEKMKINCTIYCPSKININFESEWEPMSFYSVCVNEVRDLFEWWNEYIFVAEEVEYIKLISQSLDI